MKNTTIISLSLLASISLANAGVRENGGFLVPAAARIEFFSPGNGIDRELKEAVDTLIQEYKNAGLVQTYTEKRWGMEGEVTLCVMLKDLDSSRELNEKLAKLVESGAHKTHLEFVAGCEERPGKVNDPFRRK